MQSQGSTSSQPSFDSLSSSDSLLLSDSEQAEDDADVFLTDSSSSIIIGAAVRAGGGATASRDGGSESPGSSQWTCDGFTDREEEEELYKSEQGGTKATESTSRAHRSQGDLLFAQKVRKGRRTVVMSLVTVGIKTEPADCCRQAGWTQTQ